MSIQPKAQMADPRKLRPNPWNTNVVDAANEAKLEESLKKFGMFKPVIVRELPTGELEILGGEHRAGAAVRLGIKDIPIMNLGPIPDAEAKKIGLVDNGRYGNDDSLQLAALLKELGDIDDLASFMPYSDQDFNNIMEAAEINLDDLEGDYSDGDFSGDIPSADDVLTDLQDLKLKTKSFRVYFSFRF